MNKKLLKLFLILTIILLTGCNEKKLNNEETIEES